MLVNLIEVPTGTRLAFQPENGPLTHSHVFFDMGLVVRAEQHVDEVLDSQRDLEDNRMVLECLGIEASELSRQLRWPQGETVLLGTVRFGDRTYPATLQVRPRRQGLRAILRSAQ